MNIDNLPALKRGMHEPGRDMCAMEAVAYVAGEPWSDRPQCACPVIANFVRSWNDALPTDADRDRLLKPLIPMIVGTRSASRIEKRRAAMAADWLIRTHTPAWLRLGGLHGLAELLASTPEITEASIPRLIEPMIRNVQTGALVETVDAEWPRREAAVIASRRATEESAGTAACKASLIAGWELVCAKAGLAARVAARHVAWIAINSCDAAHGATAIAGDASRGALSKTISELQESAVDLVKRMCAVREAE